MDYFHLQVEAGLIDKAHHEGHARKAIEETIEFDKAVRKTMQVLHDHGLVDDTLVVVTGGHGHTMSINGYPNRNESIFGKNFCYAVHIFIFKNLMDKC